MVATLSVSLPVSGTGGELAVRHRGREVRIDMNAAEPSELPYAAFYADCEHETRPVTAGHRLSLVFNLSLRPGDTETPRHAPDFTDLVSPISERLAAWSGGGPEKLVWLLEHDYSQAGLSFDALKNADASLGGVLKLAAERADCALYAAIVHIREEGTASYADGSYYDGWYGRGGDHHEAEFDEVIDGHYWLDSWAGVDGERPEFGEIALNPEELLPVGAIDGAVPDEEWVNEASGNAGVTVERAYRHAAFVIWPGAATLDVLTGANILRAVAWIRNRLERNGDAGRRLLARLIGAWPEIRWGTDGPKLDAQARREMLDLLMEVGDPTLATHFVRDVLQGRFDGSEIDGLRNVLTLIAPGDIAECLADLVRLRFSLRPRAVLELLIRVGEMPQFRWRAALGESVRAAVAALPEALSSQREQDGGAPLPRARRQRIDDAATQGVCRGCGLDGRVDANGARGRNARCRRGATAAIESGGRGGRWGVMSPVGPVAESNPVMPNTFALATHLAKPIIFIDQRDAAGQLIAPTPEDQVDVAPARAQGVTPETHARETGGHQAVGERLRAWNLPGKQFMAPRRAIDFRLADGMGGPRRRVERVENRVHIRLVRAQDQRLHAPPDGAHLAYGGRHRK